MNADILFERDMLYPTDNSNEPGSIHIQVFGPDQAARIPIVLEGKSSHSPLKHIDSIVRIMQSDIFDRVFIDIRKNADIYIRATDETEAEFGGHSHIKVRFSGDRVESEGVDR